MRAVPVWVDKVHDKDKNEQCIFSMCFNPDGSQLISAAGNRVLVYDTEDGSLIQPLKGHKDTVYCVCYSRDGKRFASGGADKSVIIWTSTLEGILKYSHNETIQALAYNPISHQLASCSANDFGLWSPEQKNVTKYKVTNRITCCAWTNDGQYLALGLNSGQVSIRNKSGEEKMRIDRPGGSNSSVFSIAWNPSKEENLDLLCVADWGQALSFYSLSGKMVGRERNLGYDPCCVSYFNKGEYILAGGSNKSALLYSKEGVHLGVVGEQKSWVWCCAAKPDSNFVAVGCQDGTIAFYQLIFSTVHGLYKERYAFRENMTDVIIQHLITEQKVRIKCRDLVKKIAIFKHRLAVQLPERIIIYELYSQGKGTTDMHYRVRDKINKKFDCNLLVVCTNNLVLCQEKRLLCLDFTGSKEREWALDSLIRYIKVVGGPASREGLLLGLKNGQVLKIFIDNPFPVNVLKISSAIRCLDLSSLRMQLAIVDEHNTLLVYNIQTKALLYEEANANSVAWNSQYEDMLCFSGNNFLKIKSSDFPTHQQKLLGFVVGFSGSKIFCLHIYNMFTVEVPQSASMYQYLDKKMFEEAYNVASMGVTTSDYDALGYAALEERRYDVALKAFTKTKNLPYVMLIRSIEERRQRGDFDADVFMGEILAYQGKFSEAAQLFKKSGRSNLAMEMYSDLRMFDLAQEYMTPEEGGDTKKLIKKKAEWARNINEPRAAAEMYLSAGETLKAIEIMAENGWSDMLIDLGRKLDKADEESLGACAEKLTEIEAYNFAIEVFKKIGNHERIAELLVASEEWEDAFQWVEKYPDYRELVYVPYATALAEQDKFLQSQRAFHKAGKPVKAFKVLEQLTLNAVNENRFDDAGYYYWMLSMQCLEIIESDSDETKEKMLSKFYDYQTKGSMYYVYHTIQRYMDEPFTSYMPEALFNISRFLMHELMHCQPPGIMKFSTLYTLAKQARNIEAFKLARYALDKIKNLKVPVRFQDDVDLASLKIRTKPFQDSDEHLPLCYRCSTNNPLVNNAGNVCVNCRHPFIFSFISFEVLPLVEFVPEEGISDEEAVRLLLQTTLDQKSPDHSVQDRLTLDGGEEDQWTAPEDGSMADMESRGPDPFTTNLMNFYPGSSDYNPVMLNRAALISLEPHEVYICRWPKPLRFQYYRNLMVDVPITQCNYCFKMFHTDDYILQLLQKGHCPFCRTPNEEGQEIDPDSSLYEE